MYVYIYIYIYTYMYIGISEVSAPAKWVLSPTGT